MMTETELLEELARVVGLDDLQPGEITVSMLKDKTGKCWSTCAKVLDERVDAGLMQCRWVIHNGKRQKAYRAIEQID